MDDFLAAIVQRYSVMMEQNLKLDRQRLESMTHICSILESQTSALENMQSDLAALHARLDQISRPDPDPQ